MDCATQHCVHTKRLLEALLPAGLYSCVSCARCDAMVGVGALMPWLSAKLNCDTCCGSQSRSSYGPHQKQNTHAFMFCLRCAVTVNMVSTYVRMHFCTVVETVENIDFRYYWELCVLIGYVGTYVDGWRAWRAWCAWCAWCGWRVRCAWCAWCAGCAWCAWCAWCARCARCAHQSHQAHQAHQACQARQAHQAHSAHQARQAHRARQAFQAH